MRSGMAAMLAQQITRSGRRAGRATTPAAPTSGLHRRQRRRLAAPTDPGRPLDLSIPLHSGPCDPDVGLEPVMDTKLTCKVPNWKNVALKSAARQLTRADCARGKVTY